MPDPQPKPNPAPWFKTYGWLIAVVLVIAQQLGWLTKEQADKIKDVIPAKAPAMADDVPVDPVPAPEPTPAPEPQPEPTPEPVPETIGEMSEADLAELIRLIIRDITPPAPGPDGDDIEPVTTAKILLVDQSGEALLDGEVEAGQLFRVSAIGVSESIGWQPVKSGDVRLSASTDGSEFAGYLTAGQWVEFGLTDFESKTLLSLRVTCNQAPQPPPDGDPVPPGPKPEPLPTPGRVSFVVVHDVKQITPEAAIVLNATDTWNGFTSQGSDWLFYDKTSTEPEAKQAIKDAAGITLPALIIYDKSTRKRIDAVPLPGSVEALKTTAAKYMGAK